ncbi:serine hydrolase-like protein [Copidosoma floridanum]|uniref:serine hydrolase-like protein n=1 Tax=Copidosoma floridanum TaxID=29053 RepID=UPI0006C96CE7|nr:serine hydrolase-like protein [Copidosoma floridanum]
MSVQMSEKSTLEMLEPKEIRVSVPWGHVAARAYGSPVDFPVLLVHGVLDNAGSFHRLISHLPSNYYYVAIDLPGHGLSSHFPTGLPLNFLNYVLVLRYVIEEFNWPKLHIVSHSLGAQLSVFYTFIYPGRVQRLVVLEGFYPRVLSEHQLLPWIRKTLDSATKQDTPWTYTREQVMHSLKFKRNFALNSAAAEAMFDRSVTKIGNDSYRYNRDPRLKTYFLPLLSHDQLIGLLQKVDVKILGLFAQSSAEMYLPKAVRESAKLVEGLLDAKITFVPGNHDMHNNHPERVAPYIIAFLRDNNLVSKL